MMCVYQEYYIAITIVTVYIRFQEIIQLIVGYTTASTCIVHMCITEMVTAYYTCSYFYIDYF